MRRTIIGLLLIFIALCMACSNSRHEPVEVSTIQDTLKITTEPLLPPDTTWISSANAPQVLTAPKPEIVPLQYPFGLGLPIVSVVDVASGLPANIITDVVVDKDGYLWASGLGNLSKYDGTKFTNYSSMNGMGSGFVNRLLISRSGDIWVGNYDGVFRFDGKAFHRTALSDFELDFNLRDMVEDSAGVLWVASNIGLYRMEGDSVFKFGAEHGVPDNLTWGVIVTIDGKVLIDTQEGILQVKDTMVVPFNEIPNIEGNYPSVEFYDSKNNIWFSRNLDGKRQLGKYDGVNTTLYGPNEGFPSADYISEMWEDENGNIWILAINELISFNGEKFMSYSFGESNSIKFATSITKDDVGNFWIGSDIGLVKLSYNYLNNIEVPKTESVKAIGDQMLVDNLGRKWTVDSDNKVVICYHKMEAHLLDISKLFENVYINKMHIDKRGELWLFIQENNSGKLLHIAGEKCYVYGPEQGMTYRYVQQIVETEDGAMCFYGQGGKSIFNGRAFLHFGSKQGIPEQVVSTLIDSKGNEWLGSEKGGMIMLANNQIIRYQGENVPTSYVLFISEDPFGNIWFATDQSMIKFDGTQFKKYGEEAGLSKLISGISVDTSRRLLWFSMINGLANLSFDEIDSLDPKFNIYSQRNGFDAISSHFQNSISHFDSAGVWGSAFSGVYRFDYDKVTHFDAPKLEIQNIRVNNQPVVWSLMKNKDTYTDSMKVLNESVLKFGKKLDSQKKNELTTSYGRIGYDSLQRSAFVPINLSLPYNNNSITFEFSSISPSFGKHTEYRYKLEGYEENWSPLSTKNEAYFGNMSEGEYTFRLEATSAYGTHSELSYTFRVLPPWWRTWWAYVLYGLLLALVLKRVHMYQKARSIRQERERAQQVELKQAKEIEKAYHELKATQQQLIQSEKMASLGELTAGIAHEIQNPLNFVNNFSEISTELIEEMKTELDKGDLDEAKVIADDIKQNLEKINFHGKRADGIVKGMLQHSRNSSGTKEPTDINVLADEYLRLAYHGLRAKDKSFNATLNTHFDENLGKINVVPQDIGRAILNLITNAFYAVAEKATQLKAEGKTGFEPTVSVSTKKVGNQVEIIVSDNGMGIPDHIKDKIFNPFFTTKPTGKGTGLGLSLSYDILKAHGGSLQVSSVAGQSTEFVLTLPI